MRHWGRIIGVAAVLLGTAAGPAQARLPQPAYGRALLVTCDKPTRVAVFEAQIRAYRRAPRMQLRFTLQASTPDSPKWRRLDVAGFGTWITAPANVAKYTYDKTVRDLLPPASYRVVVDFRWRDARGRTVRTERVMSPVCRQPDTRPDLVLRTARVENGSYIAVVFNRGREAAGAFAVDFLLDGMPVATVEVAGLAPGASVTVTTPAPSRPACTAGSTIEAVADPRSQIDEANEENNAFSTVC